MTSDKFIVSARKYRPQNFSTVVGQGHITTTLKNAIKNNQLAHAFLFCGPRGVGKTTCARILAKTINCENQTPDGEACNTCNSCISFDNGTSLNIHELDAASNNSVDDIRTLVEQVRFAPQAGKYKVYIVDEVHMLSAAAFNAFLKTLEEPPPFVIFILATTEKHKILPTILSRCQIFDFKRITNNDTVQHLQEICDKEEITAEKTALHIIAQKSEGCMRDSLSILDKIVSFTNGHLTYQNTLEHLNILDEDYYFKLLDYMQQQKASNALLLFDEINQKGFEGDTVIEGFTEFIRNLLVSKDAKAAVLLDVADDFKPKYIQAAQQIHTGWLLSALNVLSESEINYKQARNKRLHVELCLLKLSYLAQAIELTETGGSVVKKKLTDVKPVSFRSLPVIEVKEEARLFVEKPADHRQQATGNKKQNAEIEKPETGIIQTTYQKPPTLGSLQKIREKVAHQNKGEITQKEITDEALKNAWQLFTDKLSAKENHSAVTNFKMAGLHVMDENNISITVESNIQQKFIDAERAALTGYLQDYFNNRQLTYKVIIVEKAGKEEVPAGENLSTREQYQKLIEEYPLIKELKDRLRMELDY